MPGKVALQSQKQMPEATDAPAGSRRAFLVRCWQAEEGSASGWRFSIQSVGSGAERRAFARPEDLVSYLVEVLEWTDL